MSCDETCEVIVLVWTEPDILHLVAYIIRTSNNKDRHVYFSSFIQALYLRQDDDDGGSGAYAVNNGLEAGLHPVWDTSPALDMLF